MADCTPFNIPTLILFHIAENISFEFVARFTVTAWISWNTPLANVRMDENKVQRKVPKDCNIFTNHLIPSPTIFIPHAIASDAVNHLTNTLLFTIFSKEIIF